MGYAARNSIRVEINKIDQTGGLIDAALAKEATGVGALQFGLSKPDEVRRRALNMAVAMARSEAEAIAQAAGGWIGDLVELSAQPFYQPSAPRMMRAFNSTMESASTPVMPGEMTVSATGQWSMLYLAKSGADEIGSRLRREELDGVSVPRTM